MGLEETDRCCWKGRQRGQEWEGMEARASMEKFILERRKLEETQDSGRQLWGQRCLE